MRLASAPRAVGAPTPREMLTPSLSQPPAQGLRTERNPMPLGQFFAARVGLKSP
jgi:hypothetical protein